MGAGLGDGVGVGAGLGAGPGDGVGAGVGAGGLVVLLSSLPPPPHAVKATAAIKDERTARDVVVSCMVALL